MGGPLTIGDIEDVNGRECVRCPWHHYPVVLEDGSKLYRPWSLKPGNCNQQAGKRLKRTTSYCGGKGRWNIRAFDFT